MTAKVKLQQVIDRRSTALAVALALAFLAPAAGAQVRVDPEVGEIGPIGTLPVKDGVVQLSLDEAIRVALERNLGLVVERYRLASADYDILRNQGIFDQNATVGLLAWEEESPAASNLDVGLGGGPQVQIQENQRVDLGWSRLVPSGGTASFSVNNSRFVTNSTFATLNPSFRVDFDLGFSQPLLRNFGTANTRRGIRVARLNRQVSRENFELQVQAVVQLVEQAYWNLVEAREQYVVAEESLALAKELHEQNRIRVDVGTLAPLELVQSEAGIATREEQLIRATAAIGDAEDRLRQLLNVPTDARWNTLFEPTTEPETAKLEIDLEEAMQTALERRPDLRAKRLQQQNLEADLDYFDNQKLPRLDLDVTYGYNGVGGDVTVRDIFTGEIISTAPGGYSDALTQVSDREFVGWRVALNFAYPIENRVAKAQSALAEIAFDRGDAELADQELAALTEVRRLARAVDTANQALASARVSQRLEEENLDAERKRYDNGMSTSFQVLQIQEDLTEARQRVVNATTGLRKAMALYFQATGELLSNSGIEIAGE
ncbi:MAG: TolC family protein [Thermoanaerobaculia bacterium]|nr:TolC family protein [Thermoanaerobaculia bacterium]